MSPNVLRKLRAVDDAQKAKDGPAYFAALPPRYEGLSLVRALEGATPSGPVLVGHEPASA